MQSKSTQSFVPIKEIRDGIAIMQDGSMRAVVMTSSINFALKSVDEQTAIIYQFQNFLNSLNFSIQITAQSRRLDIKPYIGLLEDVAKEQKNELLRIQTNEYIDFIKNFTSSVNIMTKTFFVIIPYTPAIIETKKGILSGIMQKTNHKGDADSFEENRTQLLQRMEVVVQGLSRLGVRGVPLGTEELIELYYKTFNPGEVEKPMNIGSTLVK